MSNVRTVVVYHSGYGHTQRLAQAVAQGAEAELIAIDAEGVAASDELLAVLGPALRAYDLNGDDLTDAILRRAHAAGLLAP